MDKPFSDVGQVAALLHRLHRPEEGAVDFAPHRRHVPANLGQLRGGVVADVALGVKHRVNGLDELGVGFLAFQNSFETWPRVVALGEHLQHGVHDARGGGDAAETRFVEDAVTHGKQFDFSAQLVELEQGEPMSARANASHFVGFLQTAQHPNAVLARHEAFGAFFAGWTPRQLGEHGLDHIELKVLGDAGVKMVNGGAVLHRGKGVP